MARKTSCWRRCSRTSCCASRRRRLHRRRSPDCPAYGQRPCSVVPWWRGSGVVSQAHTHEQQQHAHGPAFPFVTRYIGIPLAAPGTLPAPGLAARGPFVSVRAADETGQTYLFGGPSPGNPSVPSNATCTSSPRRTAPSTGKHSLLFCLAVRTAYCTADPTFVGAGNCAAPGSIGEHEDEDRSASEAAMDSTIWRRCGPAWAFRQLLINTIES